LPRVHEAMSGLATWLIESHLRRPAKSISVITSMSLFSDLIGGPRSHGMLFVQLLRQALAMNPAFPGEARCTRQHNNSTSNTTNNDSQTRITAADRLMQDSASFSLAAGSDLAEELSIGYLISRYPHKSHLYSSGDCRPENLGWRVETASINTPDRKYSIFPGRRRTKANRPIT